MGYNTCHYDDTVGVVVHWFAPGKRKCRCGQHDIPEMRRAHGVMIAKAKRRHWARRHPRELMTDMTDPRWGSDEEW